MGKIGRTLFGGPEKKREDSWNNAYDDISAAYKPALGYVTQGGDAIGNLLGLNGSAAQTDGLSKWAESGGMRWIQDEANRGINANKAAKGLLNSGSTLTALQDRQNQISSTYLKDYMGQLFNLGNMGIAAGGVLSDAGKQSKGKAEGEKKGVVQSIAKAVASTQGG